VAAVSLKTLDRLLAALKATPRTGWMLRGVHAAIAESIAEHTAESAILALYVAEMLGRCGVEVDAYRAASIAAVHDIAEAIVGDIVKYTTDAIGKKLKEEIEAKALRETLGDTLIARLALSYIEQNTVEAKVSKLAEQLSTLLQAKRYISQGYSDVCEIAVSMAKSIVKILAENNWAKCLADVENEARDTLNKCSESP
jgi:putative hydrolase of HD superfamily